MTPSPDNTPPPAPRKPITTPPPPPRKPRRPVRKRRRPPRESRTPPPACPICKRRRPLRTSGLCWSLECAMHAAQEGNPRNTRPGVQESPAAKLPQSILSAGLEGASAGVAEHVHETSHHSATEAADEAVHSACAQPKVLESDQPSRLEVGEQVDRRSLEEEIQRQEKDVDRGDSPEQQQLGSGTSGTSDEESGSNEEGDNDDGEDDET